MEMQTRSRLPVLIALAALGYACIHLAYEHFTVGVQSHHLLNRAELPAISNWLGLIVLPIIGCLLGIRVRNCLREPGAHQVPLHLWAGLVGFDPTNGKLANHEFITVAWGRDFMDVTPLRGVVLGGGEQKLEVLESVSRI